MDSLPGIVHTCIQLISLTQYLWLPMLFTKYMSKIWLLLYCLIVDRELLLHVVPEDYMHLIKPESMVKVYLKGTVLDNNRSYARQDTFTFTKPTLEIQVNLIYSTITHRRVQRGGSGGPDPPFSWTPPFSSVTPPLQPNPISQTNVM